LPGRNARNPKFYTTIWQIYNKLQNWQNIATYKAWIGETLAHTNIEACLACTFVEEVFLSQVGEMWKENIYWSYARSRSFRIFIWFLAIFYYHRASYYFPWLIAHCVGFSFTSASLMKVYGGCIVSLSI
jgi:hypothetical protein